MIKGHAFAAALAAAALILSSGCAVTSGKETVGSYIDDTTITTQVKSRFIENKEVDGGSISVATLNGTVMLTGFAKDWNERSTAEWIAGRVKGVRLVKNEIVVRP